MIDAQAIAAINAQQDADFGRFLAAVIFIAIVIAVCYWRTDEASL